jgi:predicted transposase YbfD/YdcC
MVSEGNPFLEAFSRMRRHLTDSLRSHLVLLPDPRIERQKRHILVEVLVLALSAIIAGVETWEDIELFAKTKKKFFKKFLSLPNGIPSHDTFRRVFILLDPKSFSECFLDWVRQVTISNDEFIGLDGKALRGSFDTARGQHPLYMVSAWASKKKLVLGQVKVDSKSNEITAIPQLIELLDIKGCVITIDAIGCQTAIASLINRKGGDYILAVKKNQGTLFEQLHDFFEESVRTNFEDVPHQFFQTLDGDHGRVETRRYYLVDSLEWLEGQAKWKGLKAVGMVESERKIDGKTSIERRYYILSFASEVKRFGTAVRGHWGIENSLHWVLDVAFREDKCRIRTGNAPENMSVLRHMAVNLLKVDQKEKRGIKARMLKAGWDEEYLWETLNAKLF